MRASPELEAPASSSECHVSDSEHTLMLKSLRYRSGQTAGLEPGGSSSFKVQAKPLTGGG